uniref:Uncharacterized protein n=1 Tax=Anguilla anguilla TaxID=7936 RepID=A0A0E9TKJ2_ANGAN
MSSQSVGKCVHYLREPNNLFSLYSTRRDSFHFVTRPPHTCTLSISTEAENTLCVI